MTGNARIVQIFSGFALKADMPTATLAASTLLPR
jgi:hypothetical protein